MANAGKKPLESRASRLTMGVLAVIAAVLSVAIYAIRGHWPAELGGVEPVFFVLLGIGLIGYSWLGTR